MDLEEYNEFSVECNKSCLVYNVPTHILYLSGLLHLFKINFSTVQSLFSKITQENRPLNKYEILNIYSNSMNLFNLAYDIIDGAESYCDYPSDIDIYYIADVTDYMEETLCEIRYTEDYVANREAIVDIIDTLVNDTKWLVGELEAIDYAKAFILK